MAAWRVAIGVALLVAWGQGAAAAPGQVARPAVALHDLPGWLSQQAAAKLNVGIDVLLPADVPAPFSGEPEISAGDGSYRLYWLIPGSPPTYVQITGERGGSIPAYSKYDRNVQLQQNATVQGTAAYHDLTPIYDLVYWEVGGVVYSVEGRNLAGTDAVSLANGLVALTPVGGAGSGQGGSGGNGSGGRPGGGTHQIGDASLSVPGTVQAGQVVTVTVGGVDSATLAVDQGAFVDTGDQSVQIGSGTVDWRAPATDRDLKATFVLSNPDSGQTLATAEIAIHAAPAESRVTSALDCPAKADSGAQVTIGVRGSGDLTIESSDGSWPAASPNTEFAPAADGGSRLAGTMPQSGAVTLSWQAPEAAVPATIRFAVTDGSGNTVATCQVGVAARGSSGAKTGNGSGPTSPAGHTPPPGSIPGDGTAFNPPDFEGPVQRTAQLATGGAGDSTGIGDVGNAPIPNPLPTPTTAGSGGSAATSKRPTATAAPTATLAPTNGPAGMVAIVIGPDGGQLSSPGGATVIIPAGALGEPSTVSIRPVGDAKLPVVSGITLVPGTGFDVTVASADGKSVEKLNKPATLRISVPKGQRQQGMQLYWVNGSTLELVANVSAGESDVSAPLSHFSRYAAGAPGAVGQSSARNVLPLLLAALGAVLALLVILGLGSLVVRRRPRTVAPRRHIPPRTRYR